MHSVSTGIFLALSTIAATIVADPFQSASAQAPSAAEAPISAAEARETAADFARMLEENVLHPDVAKKYAERLRSGAAEGEYDRVETRGALASLLTKQVQAIFPDGHLKIWPAAVLAGRSRRW